MNEPAQIDSIKWRTMVLIATITLGLWVLPLNVTAHPFTIDQANDISPTSIMHSVYFNSFIGQEFTPTLPSLAVVELMTMHLGIPNGPPSCDFFVNIREGNTSGPVLGTSETVTLPAGFGEGSFGEITHFDFLTPVQLTPGNLYVIEILVAPAGSNCYVGTTSGSGYPASTYPGGNLIIKGMPVTDDDMWFREGPAADYGPFNMPWIPLLLLED